MTAWTLRLRSTAMASAGKASLRGPINTISAFNSQRPSDRGRADDNAERRRYCRQSAEATRRGHRLHVTTCGAAASRTTLFASFSQALWPPSPFHSAGPSVETGAGRFRCADLGLTERRRTPASLSDRSGLAYHEIAAPPVCTLRSVRSPVWQSTRASARPTVAAVGFFLKFYRCSSASRGMPMTIANAVKARKTPVSRAFTPTRGIIQSGND